MDWLIEKLPVLVFVAVAVAQVIRALMKSRDAKVEHEDSFDESEEQRRVQEIQERIRKVAADRGRQGGGTPTVAQEQAAPPILRPEPVEMGDVLGELLGRPPETVERKVPSAALTERRAAEVERQAELAEKMRELAEARELAKRRAAHLAVDAEAAARSEAGLLTAVRGRLDEDLRDPASLRRAFVLREVLGPPVGMR